MLMDMPISIESIDIGSIDIELIEIEDDDTTSIDILLPEAVSMSMSDMLSDAIGIAVVRGSCGSFATMESNPNPGPA